MMSSNHDPFDLERFVTAQSGVYSDVCAELRAGQKRGHWMWFIFPQLTGLGFSAAAQHYGIGSLEESRAYLAHPILGPRLTEVTALMLSHRRRRLIDVLGSPDDTKFRSSMTLFLQAGGPGSVFDAALAAFYRGEPDQRTLDLLSNR